MVTQWTLCAHQSTERAHGHEANPRLPNVAAAHGPPPSNWSGRAEAGRSGDNDFRAKVSPDGASSHEAVIVDQTTGAVRLPGGMRHAAAAWS